LQGFIIPQTHYEGKEVYEDVDEVEEVEN